MFPILWRNNDIGCLNRLFGSLQARPVRNMTRLNYIPLRQDSGIAKRSIIVEYVASLATNVTLTFYQNRQFYNFTVRRVSMYCIAVSVSFYYCGAT